MRPVSGEVVSPELFQAPEVPFVVLLVLELVQDDLPVVSQDKPGEVLFLELNHVEKALGHQQPDDLLLEADLADALVGLTLFDYAPDIR